MFETSPLSESGSLWNGKNKQTSELFIPSRKTAVRYFVPECDTGQPEHLPKSYNMWGGWLRSCKSDSLCSETGCIETGRERERALIGGQLLDGLKCCYTSKPHIMGLDDKIL